MLESELLPVQLFYLQAPKKFHVDEMFDIILKDLTLRKILRVQKINSFPTERSKKTQKYYMFTKGELFEGYEPQQFEKSIMVPFKEMDQVQFKTLTNFVIKKYAKPSGFIEDQCLNPLSKKGYVSTIPLLNWFGFISVKAKATSEVNKVNEYINQLENKLQGLIDGDVKQFIQALNEGGIYVFRIAKTNSVLFKSIIEKIKQINITKPMGAENDLTPFVEALNIDMSFMQH